MPSQLCKHFHLAILPIHVDIEYKAYYTEQNFEFLLIAEPILIGIKHIGDMTSDSYLRQIITATIPHFIMNELQYSIG